MASTGEGGPSSEPAQSTSAVQSKEAWNNAAEGYHSSFARYPLHSGQAGLDAAKVQPGEKLLDVACGPGALAIDAAKRKGAQVDCIDFSEEMIKRVQEKLEKDPCTVTPHVMDGQSLQFEDTSFDVVSSSFGVMLFPDWQRGLKEMVRVVKPGGRILLVVPDADSKGQPGLSSIELFAQARSLRFFQRDDVVLEAQFKEVLPLPIPKGLTALGRVDLMREVLSNEGLQNIEVSQVPFSLRIDDTGSFTKHCMVNPLMQEVQKKLSEERCEELVPAIQKALEDCKLEDGSCGKCLSALIAVAYKQE